MPHLKRDLEAGRCSIEEVLSDPPAFAQTARVADLLLALPKYGPVKVDELLGRCRIAPSKTIGGSQSASATSSPRCWPAEPAPGPAGRTSRPA